MTAFTAILVETADRIFRKAEAWPSGGFDRQLWSMVEQAGIDRLLLPENMGGAGDEYADTVAVATRFGAGAAALPLLETIVGNWCLAHAGLPVPVGPKALLLSHRGAPVELDIDGKLRWIGPAEVSWEPIGCSTVVLARRKNKHFIAHVNQVLDGEVGETLAGEPVRYALSDGGVAVAEVAPWLREADLPLALLALLKAAAISGAAETAVTMTIEYANIRVQFGRRIGNFQAVQHIIARMAEEAAAATAAVQSAGQEFANSPSGFASAIAKGRASEAAGEVASAAHQVHGAIGFTAEHNLHRFTRRLWSWRDDAGDEAYWYEKLGKSAAVAGPAGLWPGIVAGLQK